MLVAGAAGSHAAAGPLLITAGLRKTKTMLAEFLELGIAIALRLSIARCKSVELVQQQERTTQVV
jgi:hypothetical protein